MVEKAYKTNGKSMILRFARCGMRKPSKTLIKTKAEMKHRKVKKSEGQKGL